MKKSLRVFKVGTRSSKLALTQTDFVIQKLHSLFPNTSFEKCPVLSPGDRDKKTNLKTSPSDFFTRDLDEGILNGSIDCAIHSAKDLPDPVPDGLDWMWLPWKEDARDALILPVGKSMDELPSRPVIGISSERREEYSRKRFPSADYRPIRGNIEERLSQLDQGDYDLLIMASAALIRLNLEDRITEWIPAEDLMVPDGQGVLAMTFKQGDHRFHHIRNLMVKTVTFVGAGVGTADMCTLAGIHALKNCDICIHDRLLGEKLLEYLPPEAKKIDAGKKCGEHKLRQPEITRMITDYTRRGLRVVRLKGGDPGIFGRLAEEIEALEALALPAHVIPGVSSLNVATTGTGILLTRRGVARGFTAMTGRQRNGGTASVQAADRAKLPLVFFMSITTAVDIAKQLLDDGMSKTTPMAMVFDAGSNTEQVIRSTLEETASLTLSRGSGRPGLFIIGEIARDGFRRDLGALGGIRVLVTCSNILQLKTSQFIRDFGGHPIQWPLIKLRPSQELQHWLTTLDSFSWLVITSPSSVRCFMDEIHRNKIDMRRLPKILVTGEGTARTLREYGLYPDAMPSKNYCTDELLKVAEQTMQEGKILRLRSDKAGPQLAERLRQQGLEVEDCILYHNDKIMYEKNPDFDVVFFASASAVASYLEQWDAASLEDKTILVIGQPTARMVEKAGLTVDIVAQEATVEGSISTLAQYITLKKLEEMQ